MEDVPWNMPSNAYGIFELEGLCIWVNQDDQADLATVNTGVVSHEFTHYVHSLSTARSIDDLLSLLFVVHAGIQQLESLTVSVSLPLRSWSSEGTCPDAIKKYVQDVNLRKQGIRESFGVRLDTTPPASLLNGDLYIKDDMTFIKTTATTGAPVARRALMEGAALAKKCEALGDESDLNAKQSNSDCSHYFAAHAACTRANPRIHPLFTSAFLCDVSLCASDAATAFRRGLAELKALPEDATIVDYETRLTVVYDDMCRDHMHEKLQELTDAYAALPTGHRVEHKPSWAALMLRNSRASVELRQNDPLALIKPTYLDEELLQLAKLIGSPVVITNDMKLASLTATPKGVNQARSAVRTLSQICKWLLQDEGPLKCPYAGCPGCPEIRRGSHCTTDATIALTPPDSEPWCALLYSAHQLGVAPLLRREADKRI